MKLVAVVALLCLVAVSSIRAQHEVDVVGEKIPASVLQTTVKSAGGEGAEVIAIDGAEAAVYDDVDENPLLRGLIKKCKNSKCRQKCNAKGKNGACVWIKCVCWR